MFACAPLRLRPRPFAVTACRYVAGVHLWQPDPAEPELLEWYRPLFAAARQGRRAEVPWPVHPDEFDLLGRADRARHPAVWVYRHRASGGLLCCDTAGQTYRFVKYRSGRAAGRFLEIDHRHAVWAAGLPSAVQPVWYEPPRAAAAGYEGDDWDRDRPAQRWRRKRHLWVVPGPASA